MKSKKPYSTENRGSAVGGKEAGSHRTTRVEGEMREVIATYLLLTLRRDLPGMVTVTRVIVSKDLRNAKVLFTVMDPTGESGLEGAALNKATLNALKAPAAVARAAWRRLRHACRAPARTATRAVPPDPSATRASLRNPRGRVRAQPRARR